MASPFSPTRSQSHTHLKNFLNNCLAQASVGIFSSQGRHFNKHFSVFQENLGERSILGKIFFEFSSDRVSTRAPTHTHSRLKIFLLRCLSQAGGGIFLSQHHFPNENNRASQENNGDIAIVNNHGFDLPLARTHTSTQVRTVTHQLHTSTHQLCTHTQDKKEMFSFSSSSKNRVNLHLSDIRSFFNAALASPSTTHAAASSSSPAPASSVRSSGPLLAASLSTSAAFLASPSPALSTPAPISLPLPILFPLLTSLFFNASEELLLPLLAFNLAVWHFRKPAQASRLEESRQWLVNRIVELSLAYFNTVQPKLRKRKKAVDLVSESKVHDDLVAKWTTAHRYAIRMAQLLPTPVPAGRVWLFS